MTAGTKELNYMGKIHLISSSPAADQLHPLPRWASFGLAFGVNLQQSLSRLVLFPDRALFGIPVAQWFVSSQVSGDVQVSFILCS